MTVVGLEGGEGEGEMSQTEVGEHQRELQGAHQKAHQGRLWGELTVGKASETKETKTDEEKRKGQENRPTEHLVKYRAKKA